ncbi:MAG: DUF560 domain-containing protein [Alphaproteobacteria bacterium]|nr:DUF560 domain-containing protein [Alphaproteobacteria bacterium]
MNINADGGLLISPQLADDIYGHFKVSATGNLLTGSKQFNYNLGGELGLSLKQNADKYAIGLSYNRQFFDNNAYYSQYGIWAIWDKALSDKLNWSGRFSFQKMDYDGAIEHEYYSSLAQTFSYEQSAELGFHLAPTIAFKKSYINGDDTAKFGLSFGTRHSLVSYFTIHNRIAAQYETHLQTDNLFGVSRKDLTLSASIRVANSKIRIFDFAPNIEYQYQNRNSNIQLYNYQNHAITFGLTKKFK